MHEVALAVGPVAVILVGILFAIFYNQRAIEKVEPRIDRMETRIDANFPWCAIHLRSFRAI